MKRLLLLILFTSTFSYALKAQTNDNIKIHYSSYVKYILPNSLFYDDYYEVAMPPPVYSRNIGLIKTYNKSQLSLGASIGGIMFHNKHGFGRWFDGFEEELDGYTSTGTQLKGFWAEYAYSVLDGKWGLFQPYYRYEYEKLTKHDFYWTTNHDEYYVSDSRTQFRNGLGISWTSNTLWNKIQFNLKYGMDYIREFTWHIGRQGEANYYETTLTKEDNFFDSHIYLGINYVLNHNKKEPSTDTKLRKGVRIKHNVFLFSLSTQFTLSKGNTTFGGGVFGNVNWFVQRQGVNTTFAGKGINLFVQESFNTDKKVKTFIELQFSHIISYPKFETPTDYQHEYYDFIFTTSLGIKRKFLKKAFVECSLDHLFMHQTPYTTNGINQMAWSLSMAIGYQF